MHRRAQKNVRTIFLRASPSHHASRKDEQGRRRRERETGDGRHPPPSPLGNSSSRPSTSLDAAIYYNTHYEHIFLDTPARSFRSVLHLATFPAANTHV